MTRKVSSLSLAKLGKPKKGYRWLRKRKCEVDNPSVWFHYFLALGLTSFIGTLQHIKSHSVHPHASSTTTTIPHSSHLYLLPFFLAIRSHLHYSTHKMASANIRLCRSMKSQITYEENVCRVSSFFVVWIWFEGLLTWLSDDDSTFWFLFLSSWLRLLTCILQRRQVSSVCGFAYNGLLCLSDGVAVEGPGFSCILCSSCRLDIEGCKRNGALHHAPA